MLSTPVRRERRADEYTGLRQVQTLPTATQLISIRDEF
jgi:hypothetical protein